MPFELNVFLTQKHIFSKTFNSNVKNSCYKQDELFAFELNVFYDKQKWMRLTWENGSIQFLHLSLTHGEQLTPIFKYITPLLNAVIFHLKWSWRCMTSHMSHIVWFILFRILPSFSSPYSLSYLPLTYGP